MFWKRHKGSEPRKYTLTMLNREPVFLDPDLIRHTNNYCTSTPWALPDVPIVVIQSGIFYYILDGNHRFNADRKLNRPTKGWILAASDKKHLKGTLPAPLDAWVNGRSTMAQLRKSAIRAYKEQ